MFTSNEMSESRKSGDVSFLIQCEVHPSVDSTVRLTDRLFFVSVSFCSVLKVNGSSTCVFYNTVSFFYLSAMGPCRDYI